MNASAQPGVAFHVYPGRSPVNWRAVALAAGFGVFWIALALAPAALVVWKA
jgi:hypothetical protein